MDQTKPIPFWPLLVIGVILIGTFCGSSAQELNDEAHRIMSTWMLKNCEVGHEKDRHLEAGLMKWKGQLEPAFLMALDKGPNAERIADVETRAAQLFEERQKLLERGEGLGLSKEDMAVAKKMTRQDFIKREREAFILRYKSQAVAGLGLIGGPRAREALRKVANDKASPLRGSAEQAIKNLPKE